MVKNVTIVGVGWMGRGVAQVCALRGFNVTIHDLENKILEDAYKSIKEGLGFVVEKGLATTADRESAISRIRSTARLDDALKLADLVIEAVPEALDTKKAVFEQMDKFCPRQTVLATNTSTLSISAIADATSHPERVVGIHWFYPPYIMPLIEIIRGTKTSERTVTIARGFVLKAGKTPIVCEKEVPGFLVNRLQFALFSEATSLLEQGVATAEEIDTAARLSLGLKLPFFGPLKLEDIVASKKTVLAVYEYLYQATGKDKFRPPELVKEMVRKGELGLVSGKGYFDYTSEPPGAVARKRDEMVLKQLNFVAEQGYASLPS